MTEREDAPCWFLCMVTAGDLGPSPIVTVHREPQAHATRLIAAMLEAPGLILDHPFLVVELPPGMCWCHKTQPSDMAGLNAWQIDVSGIGVGRPGRQVLIAGAPIRLVAGESDTNPEWTS